MLVFIILACVACVQKERLVNPVCSMVYAYEGLSSHFGITQNPMNGCLLAPVWLQVIVCCKHATKLQDGAESCLWS